MRVAAETGEEADYLCSFDVCLLKILFDSLFSKCGRSKNDRGTETQALSIKINLSDNFSGCLLLLNSFIYLELI